MSKNRVYTLETKLEAIKLKQEGVPVKEIQETLNIKSESQVYFWWYWFRDGEHHRLTQPQGKQYLYGPEGSTLEETLKNSNRKDLYHPYHVPLQLDRQPMQSPTKSC